MAKDKKNAAPEDAPDPNARLVISDGDKNKGKKWFERARDLGDKRQFDYAIEYYISGLEFWADAVEEACKPLHGCAVARRSTGGKKPGFKDTLTRSLTDKNAQKAFMNSLWLFGRDPENYTYLEGIAKNASRLRADNAAHWACTICYKALDINTKATAKQFSALARLLEEIGDRAAARAEAAFAAEAFTTSVEVIRTWARRFPKDHTSEDALKEISTKLTILKGKYQSGDGYRDSIVNADEQQDLHDAQRSIQNVDRVTELLNKTEAEYLEDRDAAGKLSQLVDLLCRQEDAKLEEKAIGYLIADYERTKNYAFKQRADDIRMKQLGRAVRSAVKEKDKEATKKAQLTQLRFEIGVFTERTERFPTDLRVKFDLALRLFRGGKFDDAIPMLQNARSDPKNRAACGLYLGRCFYHKDYHSQAISTLEDAIEQYEFSEDDTGKSLQYWLGRAQEAAGESDAAQKTFGNLLQLDYNYRDVRVRLDGLRQAK